MISPAPDPVGELPGIRRRVSDARAPPPFGQRPQIGVVVDDDAHRQTERLGGHVTGVHPTSRAGSTATRRVRWCGRWVRAVPSPPPPPRCDPRRPGAAFARSSRRPRPSRRAPRRPGEVDAFLGQYIVVEVGDGDADVPVPVVDADDEAGSPCEPDRGAPAGPVVGDHIAGGAQVADDVRTVAWDSSVPARASSA